MALIDNIYSYYKMDEASGGALDATGNGRTLSNFGNAIGTASGIISTARDFGGVSGSTLIRNQNTTDFFCGANPFSFSFWVRFRNWPAFNDVGLCNRYEPFGQREYIVFLRFSDHKIVFNTESGASSAAVAWGSASVLNTWYHVAGGWDGTTIKLAVNAGTFVTAPYSTAFVNGGDNFKLGYEAASLDGQMDEFGFWLGRCITSTEVTQLYNNGAGLDFSQFGTVVPPPNIWNSDGTPSGGPNSIQTLHDSSNCHDGDTITIPSGTFVWTAPINLSKAITLQGNTIISGDHTTNVYTATHNTIIVDNLPTTTVRMISTGNSNLTTVLRVTGISFTGVGGHASQYTAGLFSVGGTSKKNRIDHCHFTSIKRGPFMEIFAHGIIDHSIWEQMPSSCNWHIRNRSGAEGDEEFAAPAAFGTDQFWFFEDCHVDNKSNGARNSACGSDRQRGSNVSWRYCYLEDVEIVCHGTYADRRRGGRCGEDYNNLYFFDGVSTTMDGITSGTAVYHDNQFTGTKPSGWSMQDYRGLINQDTNWGAAGGQNPWDVNATRADGTHVNGEPPFVFYSGTIQSVVQGPGDQQTITVAGSPWVVGQWDDPTKHYCVVANPDTAGVNNTIGWIKITTGNTLNMFMHSIGNRIFTAGQTFKIYQLLQPLDMPGLGQGDLISSATPPVPPTGFAGVHQQIEPAYSWNNTHTDGSFINFVPQSGVASMCRQNIHYFNNTVKPGYTPFTYPHPLVSGGIVTTRIIGLSGIPSLAFGNVTIGSASPTAILRISNTGNATLNVSSLTYPNGFSGATGIFPVPSGSFFDITVTFTPLVAQLYSGVITVASDATSGTATIVASGTGVDPVAPAHGHRKQARDAFGF